MYSPSVSTDPTNKQTLQLRRNRHLTHHSNMFKEGEVRLATFPSDEADAAAPWHGHW